jgi:hypothetical protein
MKNILSHKYHAMASELVLDREKRRRVRRDVQVSVLAHVPVRTHQNVKDLCGSRPLPFPADRTLAMAQADLSGLWGAPQVNKLKAPSQWLAGATCADSGAQRTTQKQAESLLMNELSFLGALLQDKEGILAEVFEDRLSPRERSPSTK